MKVYISADIEGVAGLAHFDEATLDKPVCEAFRVQMTREVAAACEGAIAGGANEIWVNDAHDTGRNLIAEQLPDVVRLIRGWSGHPYSMMQELDATFDAVMMIGYHARAGSDASPLAHTYSGRLTGFRLNGRSASEYLVNLHTASSVGVPVVLVSGDEGVCSDASGEQPSIEAVAVKRGIGASVICLHPQAAVERIRAAAQRTLQAGPTRCHVPLPKEFEVELTYRTHEPAYRAAFYPGARAIDPVTIAFGSPDYFEVLRFLLFVL